MLIISTVFFVGCLSINTNKVFFVWSFIFLLTIFWKTRSFEETFLYGAFPFATFSFGQLYLVKVVPNNLYSYYYPLGRDLMFNFGPMFVLILCLIFGLFFQMIKYKKLIRFNLINSIVIVILSVNIYSAISNKYFPFLSTLYVIRNSFGYFYLIFASIFLYQNTKLTRKIFFENIFYIISVFSIFEWLVVCWQQVKGGIIGLFVEQIANLPNRSRGPDEDSFLLRPVGLHGDSNLLSYYYLQIFVLVIILFYILRGISKGLLRVQLGLRGIYLIHRTSCGRNDPT